MTTFGPADGVDVRPMNWSEGGEGIIPRATQDDIDRAVIAIFAREWVITSERWVRNDVFDKNDQKTSWRWAAKEIQTQVEAQRMADRYNAIAAAHPDWKLPRIKSIEVESLATPRRQDEEEGKT